MIPIIRGLASALDHAHARHIIHRDIKPSNVLLKPRRLPPGSYRAVLTDFGLAKMSDASVMLTNTAQSLGTVVYMAPEQMDDAKNVDQRADIYSLGVIVYQMLTGALPFSGGNALQIMNAVLNKPTPDPREIVPDVPYGVVEALTIALAKDPGNRFHHATDFALALQKAVKV